MGLQDLHRLISTAYSSEKHPRWIIFIEKIVSKAHFLGYAARYVRRPPIAKWRIIKVADGQVEFVAKDTRNETLVRTWFTLDRFVRLLAAHVPDHYRHAIRYFGLLAPRAKRQRDAGLFRLLGQQMRPRPQRLSWRESLNKCFHVDPMIDSFGQEMHWV
jgi:hypothetical protein